MKVKVCCVGRTDKHSKLLAWVLTVCTTVADGTSRKPYASSLEATIIGCRANTGYVTVYSGHVFRTRLITDPRVVCMGTGRLHYPRCRYLVCISQPRFHDINLCILIIEGAHLIIDCRSLIDQTKPCSCNHIDSFLDTIKWRKHLTGEDISNIHIINYCEAFFELGLPVQLVGHVECHCEVRIIPDSIGYHGCLRTDDWFKV
mmetsp:Transcript_25638/g.55511  ORF Transcript_25638/g.55511 Transcript_25638/m.55511 type:complete len:202 (-) Transcript_25638:2477-3082(-)